MAKTTKVAKDETLPSTSKSWQVIDLLTAAYPQLNEQERLFIETEIKSILKKVVAVKNAKNEKLALNKKSSISPSELFNKMESIDEKINALGERKDTVISITEGPDNAYFILNVNGKTKSFTLAEMRSIVRMCDTSGHSVDSARKLYNWCEKNRKDVILDLELKRNDARLFEIIQFLSLRYKVKEK